MDTTSSVRNKVLTILIQSLSMKISTRDKCQVEISMMKSYLDVVFYNLHQFAYVEESTFVCSLIVIDRLLQSDSSLIDKSNLYLFIIGGVYISTKINQDIYNPHSFKYFSCMSSLQLIQIENIILSQLDYNVYINEDTYNIYYSYLNKFRLQ